MKRRALLAKIHIAKKELGLDDTVYQEILTNMFNTNSAKNCTNAQLALLVRYFQRHGWRPRIKQNKYKPDGKNAMLKKVWAICYALGYPVPEYANGVANKMFGVDRVVKCSPTQLHKIISALHYHQKRKEH